VNDLAIGHDDRLIFGSGPNGILSAWDACDGHVRWRRALADGPLTAVGGAVGSLRVLAGTRGGELIIVDPDAARRALRGHVGSVTSISMSHCGRRAATCSEDRTVRLWDLDSGTELGAYAGDAEFVCCLLAPDGRSVLAGDAAGLVHPLHLENIPALEAPSRGDCARRDLSDPVRCAAEPSEEAPAADDT
jgi:WD40 repeat protein